jgi:tRNA dimethylallyltransferase
MNDSLTTLVIVTGPTASGKSKSALSLAHSLNGEIINCDVAQLYRHANIGTAKVLPHEQEGIPHHLIDELEPTEQCSVAYYIKRADQIIAECRARGKLPIIVGGTTMYLTALLHGLIELPEPPDDIKQQVAMLSTAEIWAKLQEGGARCTDKLHPNDRLRTTRALEVFLHTGQSVSEVREAHKFRELRYRAVQFVLAPPRQELYDRVTIRSQQMLDRGLMAECEVLGKRYGYNAPLFSCIGYAECAAALAGEIAHEDVAPSIAMATRRYAKRQLTYFKNEPEKRRWYVDPVQGPREISGDPRTLREILTKPVTLAMAQERILQSIENIDISPVQVHYTWPCWQ